MDSRARRTRVRQGLHFGSPRCSGVSEMSGFFAAPVAQNAVRVSAADFCAVFVRPAWAAKC